MKAWVLAAVGLAVAPQAGLAQDAGAGEAVFKKSCLPCHAVGEGAKNKVGPILNGLEGRRAGTGAGFVYSAANKSSGITWDAATFKEYIKDPKAKIPETRMSFAGLKDEQQNNDLWAYLTQFKADGSKK
ncbi:MAG: c-type cytochrome [Xanthobacteraceae bacterium]